MGRTRLAGAVLAVAGLLTALAPAAPAAATEPVVDQDAYANDARAIAAERGLPYEQVRQQLLRQQDVGALHERVAARWRETFGGMWIDQRTSLVHVAFTRDAAANVAALHADFSAPELLRAHDVPRSYAELRATLRRMVDDRALFQAGLLAIPGMDPRGYSLDVDVRENRPVVGAESFSLATVAALTARYGDLRVERALLGGDHACTRLDCKHYVRSGLAGDRCCDVRDCTLGFTVSSGQVKYESLSAGHCGSRTWRHGAATMGTTDQLVNGGAVDAQTIVISNDFEAGPWIWVSSTETIRKVTSVQTYAALTVGQWICQSGVTSGQRCGSVLGKDFVPPFAPGVPAHNSFIHTDMCSQVGDSGAGIYMGNMAVGLVSGGSHATGCPSGFRGWHGHIEHAASSMQLLVITSNPTAPFLSSIAATGTVGTTGTINSRFSKPVRCSSVNPSDFTVRLQSTQNLTVSSTSCTSDSNENVVITTSTPLVKGTSISVSTVANTIQDPIGTNVGSWTRTTTVA